MVELNSYRVEQPPAEKLWALENLPPFSAVAVRLVQILSRPNVTVSEVGRFISAEPVFAVNVLQLANSPLFNTRGQVKSISQAIVLLGLDRVKAITMSRALREFLGSALTSEAMRLCWQNSLAGAVLAEKLARVCNVDADLAYTAGLLRDIGRLALLVKYPAPYANLLAVSQDHGFDLMTMERDLFDVDHCQAGRWILDQMPLPEELKDAASFHHQTPPDGVFGLVELVRVADLLADALGFCALALAERQPACEDVIAELPQAGRARVEFDPDEVRAEIAAKIQVLSGISKPVIPANPPRLRCS
jgi:HD-like signal output (HDOD) protein